MELTIHEKYYDKVEALLRDDPRLSTSQIAKALKYRGNESSLRMLTKQARKALGIVALTARKTKRPSAEDYITHRKQTTREQFTDADEVLQFTDGSWVDTRSVEISPGRNILVIGDQHIGIHKVRLCEFPIRDAVRRGNIDTIIINGDFLDCSGASAHPPSRYETWSLDQEIEAGKIHLRWIRSQFPAADIYFAEGNHEYRIARYMEGHAKAFKGLRALNVESLLELDKLRINFVPYEKSIQVGSLLIMHGHQYRGGGDNVAAMLLRKACCNILFHDRHRKQEATMQTGRGEMIGAWAVGCLCATAASYALKPNWQNGYAYVQSFLDGKFRVENIHIIQDETGEYKIY
jgi:predicted phosphodiesterase